MYHEDSDREMTDTEALRPQPLDQGNEIVTLWICRLATLVPKDTVETETETEAETHLILP